MHLRMSGHLSVVSAETPSDKYVHDIFTLDDNTELRFRDTRKFGTVALVSDENQVLGKLGYEISNLFPFVFVSVATPLIPKIVLIKLLAWD